MVAHDTANTTANEQSQDDIRTTPEDCIQAGNDEENPLLGPDKSGQKLTNIASIIAVLLLGATVPGYRFHCVEITNIRHRRIHLQCGLNNYHGGCGPYCIPIRPTTRCELAFYRIYTGIVCLPAHGTMCRTCYA